jgi:formiminoglutamase
MAIEEKASATPWTGRIDAAEGPRALRWHQRVRCERGDITTPGVALLAFACDAGVARNLGRVGAVAGPQSLRLALANMAWQHGDLPVFDAGDVVCDGDELESAQSAFGNELFELLAEGFRPIGIGGGHETAYGSWLGLAAFAAKQKRVPRIGIINFDAHFDLRTSDRASSGTPFKQISDDCSRRGWPFQYACLGIAETANTAALFNQAGRLGVWWETDSVTQNADSPELVAKLERFMRGVDWLYVSICLDVLPAATAPGVSAPAGFGMPLAVLESLLKRLKQSGKVRYTDVVELNPKFDIDQRTAKVAARLVWVMAR